MLIVYIESGNVQKKAYCFDQLFYEDQKLSRKLRMMITKVTKVYQDDEKKQMKEEAEKHSQILPALGKRTIEVEEDDLQEESND